MSTPWQWDGDDLLLRLHVQPKAGSTEWAGEHGDAIKLRSTAPPVDGKANAHVTRWLAGEFGVARRDVELVSGARSRRKLFRIHAPRALPAFIDRD